MQVDEKRIAIIVEEVLRQLGQADGKPTERVGQDGIFEKGRWRHGRGCRSATTGSYAIGCSAKIIDAIRERQWQTPSGCRMTVEETGLGRYMSIRWKKASTLPAYLRV